MVAIKKAFVAKRSQSLHLLRTVFGRNRACFSMEIISMPTVFIPTLVSIKTEGMEIGNRNLHSSAMVIIE